MKKIIHFFLFFFILPVSAYNLDFFTRFNDEYFENYIKEALANNHDVKQADRKVEQFRYEINKSFSNEFPQLSLSSNYFGIHFPRSDYNIFLKNNSFILPFRVNWEPDFLLKNKDEISSKKYLYKAQLQNKNATYISLLCDLTTAYINILLYDFLIKKQEDVLSNKKSNLNYSCNKLNAGLIDTISYNNTKEEYITQQLIYNSLLKNRKTTLMNFALLLGRSANCIDELKRGKFENFEYQAKIPDAIDSDIIQNRPDVIEIENKLKSAKLDITIAKKDFFPRFNISGLMSYDTAGGSFFSWNSSFAYLIAGLTQDIFNGGEKIANLKIKRAKFYELAEKYLQTDLIAIKEVANALNIIKKDTENEQTSLKKLDIEKNIHQASLKKYKRGVISIVDYLNRKNSYIQQEQTSASSKAIRLIDYITLYKAVGGEL